MQTTPIFTCKATPVFYFYFFLSLAVCIDMSVNIVSISGYKQTAGLGVRIKRSGNTSNYSSCQKGFKARCDCQIKWYLDENTI